MKKMQTVRGILFLLTLVSLLFVAALPENGVFAQDVVRLTIKNNSDRDAWLQLSGPAYYYLHAKAGATAVYTPNSGEYEYTLFHCGTFVEGEIDLTKQRTIDVPDCGSRAHYGPQDASFIDAGDMLDLVRVTIKNETGLNSLLILDGPSVFVFSFGVGDHNTYTIPGGKYDYILYSCGNVIGGVYDAWWNKNLKLDC